MDSIELYQRLALSLGIGLLIGLERGWKAREAAEGSRWAGIRTFGFLGLLGGLAGYSGLLTSDIVVLIAAAGVVALVAVVYASNMKRVEKRGATTETAGLVTFFLGLVAVRGDAALAAVLCVVVMALLGIKGRLHGLLRRLEERELNAFMKLLLLSVVALPFLPNQGYGPGAVLNPFEIWLMVILIQGIAFFGHFAIRIWGARTGPLLLGFFGGLASSTAVTVAASRMAAKMPAASSAMAAGIAMGTTVQFLRIVVLLAILNAGLLRLLTLPLLLGAIGVFLGAFMLHRKTAGARADEKAVPKIALPPASDLVGAFQFGLVLIAVLLLSHYARAAFGEGGLLAVSAISGIVDVDAVTISVARMAPAGEGICLAPAAAGDFGDPCFGILGYAIFVAVGVNAIAKLIIARWLGNARLSLGVALAFLPGFLGVAVGFLL